MIWISIAAFVITMVIKLAFDYRLWLMKKPNNHLYGPIAVTIVLIGCSWVSGWVTASVWFFGWWAIWDSIFGILIAKDIFYLGNTAFLDRMQHKYKGLQVFKYVGAIGSILYFIIKGS